jgi:hypothetical protein
MRVMEYSIGGAVTAGSSSSDGAKMDLPELSENWNKIERTVR